MINPCHIEIKVQPMGKDYVFIITGGAAHIGATVTAYTDQGKIVVEGTGLPGHKELELAKELAFQAIRDLGVTVTVIMGIHIDQATKEAIQSIVSFVRNEMDRQIQIIKKSAFLS